MKTILKLGIAGTALALTACNTTYQADPTTYAHLSCEQLKSMYDPDSSLVIPNIPDQHPGDSNYVDAKAPSRDWTYEQDLREEKSKFRSDVRAAYRANGC